MTRRPRIVVVDDDPGMVRATERVLGSLYDVRGFRSGREALEGIGSFPPDIALLDIRMPDLSGFALRDRLRDTSPDADVIFMTGSLNHLDATLIRAIRSQAFYFIQKPFDREVLLTLVDRCLELRRLSSENRRHTARLEAELAAARAFQQGLLPPPAARINGLSIAARYLPCVELGGDFYDYAAAGPDCATLLIADAAGHGVSAAMLTAVVKAAFDASRTGNYEPQAIVHRVADGVRGYEYQRYVTMLCVRIDTARGVLEYVNAGHPAGFVWSNGAAVRPLATTGVFVSPAFPDARWIQSQIAIAPGDRVLLFTDGVSERESGEDVFGERRVLEEIARCPDGGERLLDSLLEAAHQFGACAPPNDDQALITATVLGHG